MLEIACFTSSSAIRASSYGADRIELCANYAAGGITPSIDTLLEIRKHAKDIPINVMIRPRAGDFRYSAAEFETMRHEIALFSTLASGFVFGILDAHGHVDVARNAELVDVAAPLPCTFHRAIDGVVDVEKGVEMVVACGFKSVLTSGGKKSAQEGIEGLRQLQGKFGRDISLIAGGGVRSGNVEEVKSRTGVEWVHSAAITGDSEEVDGEEVKRMQEVLKKIEGNASQQNNVAKDHGMAGAD
jgi:copper homeostasis protein